MLEAPFGKGFSMSQLENIVERLRALGYEADVIPASDFTRNPVQDYADLSEREFKKVLDKITTLSELQGMANRRRYLQVNLKKYSQWQIDLIKRRKWELENG